MAKSVYIHFFIFLVVSYCPYSYSVCQMCNQDQCSCADTAEINILEWLAVNTSENIEERVYLALLEPIPEDQLRSLLLLMRNYLYILERNNPATELIELSLPNLKNIQIKLQIDAMKNGCVFENFEKIE
ncbi:hypothetical protein NX722_11770 [Endozoicomonas gorgoniicola]|uniref:Uncharacterized protein n=1 Tax=Endozoicomonas gorgoniicola TaxID=1234144 RepID=A0ABT3MW42_9GAMM|nr:hypothetical protein [Endozoicomonas gorgoniicola]MCW7553303.1 hypothetical protein [Endozoicomonas gorgoniicola]